MLLLLQTVLQADDQILETEHASGVPSGRFLANLVQTLGLEFSGIRGILELHQILHVLAEDVGAADLSAIAD